MLAVPESQPVPALADVLAWLGSSDLAPKLKALEAIIHPQFPVSQAVGQIRGLATSVSHQARQFAAIAMGAGGPELGREFAPDLARLVGEDQKLVVRIAAAHAIYRTRACPREAIDGLVAMLSLDNEPARRIAEMALNHGSPARLESIARRVREMPAEQLNLEALGALVTAAVARPGSADSIALWLRGLAEAQLPIPVRMAILASIARLTEGARGLSSLMQVVEESGDVEQRKLAMATLGSLGELAASCRPSLLRVLVAERDEECEALMYRLVVQLKTPAEDLPLQFLLRRIAEANAYPVLAGACMALTLGEKKFARYASVVRTRFDKADDTLQMPLAICYEKLTGMPIVPETAQ